MATSTKQLVAHPKKSIRLRRRWQRGVMWCLLLLAGGAVAVQVMLIVAAAWLNTGSGQRWLQNITQQFLAPMGQQMVVQGVSYNPANGLFIQRMQLNEGDWGANGAFYTNRWLSLKNIRLKLHWQQLLVLRLHFSLAVGQADVWHLPAGHTSPPSPDARPETLADMVNRLHSTVNTAFAGGRSIPLLGGVRLWPFEVKQLVLHPQVMGDAVVLSPRLKASVRFMPHLKLFMAVDAPVVAPNSQMSWLPNTTRLAAEFRNNSLVLRQFLVEGQNYRLQGKGQGGLVAGAPLNFEFWGTGENLQPLTLGSYADANATIKLAGTLQHPQLMLQAAAQSVEGNVQQVGDVHLQAELSPKQTGLAAQLRADTVYQKQPVTARVNAVYAGQRLEVTDAELTAPAIRLNGRGSLHPNAAGAFGFTGEAQLTTQNLASYSTLVGTPVEGVLTAKARWKNVDAGQQMTLQAHINQARYAEMALASAKLDVFWPNLHQQLWPGRSSADVQQLELWPGMAVSRAFVRLEPQAEASYLLTLQGDFATPELLQIDGSAQLNNLTDVFPSIQRLALHVQAGQSRMVVQGNLSASALNVTLDGENVRIEDIPFILPDSLQQASAGVLMHSHMRLTGTPAQPHTGGVVQLAGLGTGAYHGATLQAEFEHQNNMVQAAFSAKGPGISHLKAQAKFPFEWSLLPFAVQFNPATANLEGSAEGVFNLNAFGTLFLPPTQTLTGDATLQADVSGTVASPVANGRLQMKQGRFSDAEYGVELADIAADIVLENNMMILKSFTATDGEKGQLRGRGQSNLFDFAQTQAHLTMKNFHAPKAALADGVVAGDFYLTHNNDALLLNGRLDVMEMNVVIPSSFQENIPQLTVVDAATLLKGDEAFRLPLQLDVAINANNRLFVRGWGLDAEFGGAVQVTGMAENPQLNGEFSSLRGRYEEFGKRFVLTRGHLRFQGSVPPSPYLDIRATTQLEDAEAMIDITGSLSNPSLAFSATPDMPADEVLSRILFGRDTTTISPFQAVQLAQALRRFSGQGGGNGFNPLATLRSLTGVDDITVDTTEAGDTNVGVGKYLADNVYLELEQGSAENSGAASIQIELTPKLKVESEVGNNNKVGGGVFWKQDY